MSQLLHNRPKIDKYFPPYWQSDKKFPKSGHTGEKAEIRDNWWIKGERKEQWIETTKYIRRIKKDLEEEKERERDGGRFEFETLNWKVNFVNDNFWDLNIKHKI